MPGRRRLVTYLSFGRRIFSEFADPYRIERVRIPLQLIWGTRDLLSRPVSARQLKARVPHARLEMIPRCGHHPQIEAVGRFTEILEEFAEALTLSLLSEKTSAA